MMHATSFQCMCFLVITQRHCALKVKEFSHMMNSSQAQAVMDICELQTTGLKARA